MQTVAQRIAAILPADTRPAFQQILLGRAREHENATTQVARWIAAHGATHGFRTPNARERARATGRGGYLGSLGLSESELYDLVGNQFDPDDVGVRLDGPLRHWFAGAPQQPHAFRSPFQLLRPYMQLRRTVIQANCTACPHPFLDDLRGARLCPTRTPHNEPIAAEHGRAAG